MNLMFRAPDCLLVRVGELALKSPPVQRRMFSMLLDNMRAALKGTDFKFEIMMNRIFVYTNTSKAVKKLPKVFGMVSISPAWTCHSDLSEIKVLATDVAKSLKIGPKKSFAIRPHRVGQHPFSTRTIAEEAGAAVKRVTKAKVNLSKPDVEIFIETRSRKTYIYSEKIHCAGGMPLGSSGKAAAIIDSKEAAAAAWLMMKRGIEITIFAPSKAKHILKKIKSWHIGRKLETYDLKDMDKLEELYQKGKIQAVVTSPIVNKKIEKKIKSLSLLLLQPTAGWGTANLRKLTRLFE